MTQNAKRIDSNDIACYVFLKRLTNSIIFPDIGFQINALLGRIYSSEHGIVEVALIHIELQTILPNVYFAQVWLGGASLLPGSLASR